MMNAFRNILLGLTLAFAISGCAAAPLPPQPVSAELDAGVRLVPEYRLGAADKIRVNVFGEEALTGEFLVGGSGKVSLPLIGEVPAATALIFDAGVFALVVGATILMLIAIAHQSLRIARQRERDAAPDREAA